MELLTSISLTPLEIYAEFSTIVKWSTFLSSKKPPFEKTQSPNDNTEISCRENYALEIYGIFYQNHGLTPFEICPIFNYSKMTFLSSKRPPIEKTTSWKDNTKVSCTENKARGIFRIFKQNHGLTPLKKIWKIFDYSKMTFLSSKNSFWENNINKRQNQCLFYRKEGSKKYLEFLTIIMG